MWYLYILRWGDGTFYTGITRAPLEVIYRECCGTHSDALKREMEVKRLSREEKQALIFSVRP